MMNGMLRKSSPGKNMVNPVWTNMVLLIVIKAPFTIPPKNMSSSDACTTAEK